MDTRTKSRRPAGPDPLKTYPFKPGFPHELELTSIRETLRNAEGMVTEPHRAGFYQIVWVRTGKAALLLDFQSIPMAAGSLLFIRKDRVLMYDRSSGYDGWIIRFTDGFFARTPDDARFLRECPLFSIRNDAPLVSVKGGDADLAALISMVEREIGTGLKPSQHIALQNLAHNFLILCERNSSAAPEAEPIAGAAKDIARKFMDLIENGYREEKKVSAFARRLSITEKKLQSATSQVFGKLPKELIDERIALEAKRLLLFGDTSVKEIAFDLGFEEVTNFIKYFRKHAGTTPAGFRTRYRLG